VPSWGFATDSPNLRLGSVRWTRLAFVIAVVVQCWALYVPRAPSVETGLPLDKLVHVALFAVVTWLGLRAGWRWVLPAMVAQAAISELVQLRLLPNRGGDWWDFAADLVGIMIGWGVAAVNPVTERKTHDSSGI